MVCCQFLLLMGRRRLKEAFNCHYPTMNVPKDDLNLIEVGNVSFSLRHV